MMTIAPLFCSGCQKSGESNPPPTVPKIVTTKSGIEMAAVPGGSFRMGSGRQGAGESPAHAVMVDPFLIDRYEVTQQEYEKYVIGNPSKFKAPKNPVERVRWVEAALYCNARSAAEGLQPCYDEKTFTCDFNSNGYRLPTEAEWEFAARADTNSEYCFGSDERRLGDYAWFRENSSERTHPVGTKKPNPWGLYDMYGNVGEWCQDNFDPHYYQASPERNPCGPPSGQKRILRGGAWNASSDRCTSACRSGEEPGSFADACFARSDIGFRCVQRLPPQNAPARKGTPTARR
jgi:formylglycine-generating enzyme required for sulfatase activity